MRKRSRKWIIPAVIIIVALLLIIFLTNQQNMVILPESGQETELDFSGTDLQYLKEHETIPIYVEEQLQYLIGDEKGGYLQQYLGAVLQPAGIRPEFVTEEDTRVGASLCIITPQQREKMEGLHYTSPLFQMEGNLFLREGSQGEDPLRVLLVADRLKAKEASSLRYAGSRLLCRTVKDAGEAVEMATSRGSDGIIGDRCSVWNALHEVGMEGDFLAQEKPLYSYNACILVKDGESAVYQILNQCIHNADRHNLSYDASERWMQGEGPVFMKEEYRLTYMPLLIVILSVLLAFFIYYLTNRSMYQELNDRMDQITASRNEMQTTFHGVGHYMAEMTPSGEITDLNQALADDITMNALHQQIWDVLELDEEGREQIRRMVEKGAQGIQVSRLETDIGKRTFVIDVFPVEDARGEVGQLLFMAIDVTQERMAKRQMLQDNKMIAIGQLAAGVAHEIRNPLGIIRNYCYVLKTMEDEDVRAKAIEEIENAVHTSGGIINDLLDFSRASQGGQEMIDVEEHVRSLLSLNESVFRSKNIELVLECPEPIRTYIALEPFNMILLNLVKNAADAIEAAGEESDAGVSDLGDTAEAEVSGVDTDELSGAVADDAGGALWRGTAGRVTIGIKREPGDERFTLSVMDTGVGIDEDALDEIFNPFYSTKGNQGTGLGLYIVYSETEKLHGDIDVVSKKGEGTTFRVELPILAERQG